MANAIYYLCAFITLLLAVAVIIMTLMRLHCGECKRSRLKYTLVLLAALTAGLQPYIFTTLPGISSLLLTLSLLWLLLDGALSLKAHKQTHLHKETHDQIEIIIETGK